MRAADVMTTFVVSVTPETTVGEAARVMVDRRISGLPVIDALGTLVGMVSEGDLLRRVEAHTERKRPRWLEFLAANSQLASDYVKSHARHIRDVMTAPVVTATEDMPLAEIADLLERRRVKRVPIVRGDKVLGIVSRSDILRAVASGAGAQPAASTADDRGIREAIAVELKKQKWADPTESTIVVTDGVVHLWGFYVSEAERTALRVAAETVPGVRKVEDHLTERPYTYGL
jgi:CBS domain-containing protein